MNLRESTKEQWEAAAMAMHHFERKTLTEDDKAALKTLHDSSSKLVFEIMYKASIEDLRKAGLWE